MHQLSLEHRVFFDSIAESVGIEKLPSVRIVRMEMGDTSRVVADSLLFAFDAIVQNTSFIRPDGNSRNFRHATTKRLNRAPASGLPPVPRESQFAESARNVNTASPQHL